MIIPIKQILTEDDLNFPSYLKLSDFAYKSNPMFTPSETTNSYTGTTLTPQEVEHRRMTSAYDTAEGDSGHLGMVSGHSSGGGGHRFTMDQRRALMDGLNNLGGAPRYGFDKFNYTDQDLLDQYKKYETEHMLKNAARDNLNLQNELNQLRNRNQK